MARRRRRRQQDIGIVPVIVVAAVALGLAVHNSQYNLVPILSMFLVVLIIVGAGIFLYAHFKKQRLARSGIEEIDVMGGIEFEVYLQALLLQRGFHGVSLTYAYDLGVDLVARKDGHTWAIQAKRYKSAVGLDAVRQVVAAKNYYKCDRTMVITNSYFTKNARTIAESTDCVLIDRDRLIELILKK